MNFEIGKIYVVAGTISKLGSNDEKLYITTCDFKNEFSMLTETQKKGFDKNYIYGCRCKVSFYFCLPNYFYIF